MELISMQNVSFQYQDTVEHSGIFNIDLEIKKGSCVLLCGKSGSGKTTITKLINGLIPHFETGEKRGVVLLDSQNTNDMRMYQIAEKVSSVFQDPKSQFFNIDTETEIVFSLENQGASDEMIDRRLQAAIQELHIADLMEKNLFEMSNGEKQIIAFACAYAADSEIVVLDEPSSNLDLEAVEIIRQIIAKMKEKGKTIIIAEHRFSYLKGLIDDALYIKDGVIEYRFTAQEFFEISDSQRKLLGLRQLFPFSEIKINKRQKPNSEYLHTLSIENIKIAFHKKTIIENISFSLHSGDIAALVGVNGVGKTSLCRMLCGFTEPQSGRIVFDGRAVKKKQRLKNSYIVMQDTNCQLFSESVLEECLLGNPTVTKEQALKILKQLNLADVQESHPQGLSGGQRQRLSIAVALLAHKNIIIFDEPTSGLDYESMIRVSELIKELSDMGIISIIITHDMEFLEAACNRCFELTPDKIQEIQT